MEKEREVYRKNREIKNIYRLTNGVSRKERNGRFERKGNKVKNY